MTPKGLWLYLGAVLVALGQNSWAQKASNWRVYKLADGLPESACVSVAIAPQGKLLVKHLNLPFISELDGYNLTTIPVPRMGNCRVYKSPGGQLWTVLPEGLQEYRDGVWQLHPVAEIAAAFHSGLPRAIDPIPLCPVRQGQVIFLLPERLSEFDVENPELPRVDILRSASQTQLEKFTGLIHSRDGGLWVAGVRGLAKTPGPIRNLQLASSWQEFLPPASLEIQNLQEPHEAEDGTLTVVAESITNHQRLLVYFDGQSTWTSLPAGPEKIRHGWRGPDGTSWAATIDALYQWDETRAEMVESEEISARQYFDLAVEPGGTFWLATSDGLYRYAPLAWRQPPEPRALNALIHCQEVDAEGRVWFVALGALHVVQNDRHQEFPFPREWSREWQTAHALFSLRDGSVLVEGAEALLQFQPRSATFTPLADKVRGRQVRPLGLLRDGTLCVQSRAPDALDGQYQFQVFDGTAFTAALYPAPEPTLGTRLTALFAVQNGDVWVSAEHGTALYHDKKWRVFRSSDNTTPEAVMRFAELADGRIWCATFEQIWEFDGRNWFEVRGGFDRINDLVRSRDGVVWVASNTGLHRFAKNAWVENGPEEGLPSPVVRGICEDARGMIWAGTTRGLSRYDPAADRDPPKAYIQKLPENEKNLSEGGMISLNFAGRDKWKYTPRERLLYSYRVDGHEWSTFQPDTTVALSDLSPGKHAFEVVVMDRNCNVDLLNPARLEFAVTQPWYKETRLVWSSVSGLVLALFFAGLAFNRHRQLLRSYAEVEQKVAERTRELEMASRELVHSQKMNALGTLAAGIAHDFNNILSIVKGSAQIIEDNLNNPQKVRTRVDRINTVVEQGAGIVKAMLGFSRDSGQQTGFCDLNLVVADTIRLLGDRFLREAQINFEPVSGLPLVFGSKDFIQQILLNCIFNAAESMPKRKQIVLTVRALIKLPADLVLVPLHAQTYVAVSVQDFGCGIPPENLSRVFEPFFTTKALSVRRGTGLGLSMVYELAKRMDAGLAVHSVVDQGSTFTLILPVRDRPKEGHPVDQDQESAALNQRASNRL